MKAAQKQAVSIAGQGAEEDLCQQPRAAGKGSRAIGKPTCTVLVIACRPVLLSGITGMTSAATRTCSSQTCHNVLFHLSAVCHAQVVKLEQKVKTLERENNMLRQIIKNIQNPGDRSVPDAP